MLTAIHLMTAELNQSESQVAKDDIYNNMLIVGLVKMINYRNTESQLIVAMRNSAFNPIIFVKDKVTVDNVTMRMNIFDLTQMFGVGNEPSTPEEFEAMFPADYYPYNAGELMSAPVNEVIYLDTKSQETSYPIPQAILALDGYGEIGNFVDFVEKKYHKGDRTIDISDIMGDASNGF